MYRDAVKSCCDSARNTRSILFSDSLFDLTLVECASEVLKTVTNVVSTYDSAILQSAAMPTMPLTSNA